MKDVIKKLIEKELSYLEDNKHRYKLDNKDGRHNKIISEHKSKIAELEAEINK